MLEGLYQKYTETVSPAVVSANYSTIVGFLEEVNNRGSKIVADLGSGVSSMAIAHATNVDRIYSVDGLEEWLKKSEQFVADNVGLNEKQEFILWEDWKDLNVQYDFIFYDMFRTPNRIKYMDNITQRLANGGYILFDDCHKEAIVAEIEVVTKRYNLTFVKKMLPMDEFGRWSELYVKN